MFVKATIHDIPAIQHIVHNTWYDTYGNILSKEQIEYMLDKIYSTNSLEQQMLDEHHFFLLNENAETIGFIDVQKLNDRITKLHKIYLLPNHQGKGYGNVLLNQAVENAEIYGSSVLQLNVNRYNTAINFYKKNGFLIVDEVDIPIGNNYFMNDFIMEKIIHNSLEPV